MVKARKPIRQKISEEREAILSLPSLLDVSPIKKKRLSRGKRKIELKFIEEKGKRSTSFSKRKKGIFRAIERLNILTGASCASFFYFNKRLYAFGSGKDLLFLTNEPMINACKIKLKGELGSDDEDSENEKEVHEKEVHEKEENTSFSISTSIKDKPAVPKEKIVSNPIKKRAPPKKKQQLKEKEDEVQPIFNKLPNATKNKSKRNKSQAVEVDH